MRHKFLFSFRTQESKVKYIIIFDRPLLDPLKGIVNTNHYIPIFTAGTNFNHANQPLWGSTMRHRFLFSFHTQESKVKYIIIFDRPPLGPLKRDCDTNHYIAIFTAGTDFNHANQPLWSSTTRHRFLFSFRTQESKVKYIIIFDRPPLGPLKRDCDNNHWIPIFSGSITVNHDNEPLWGSTMRHKFLFSFRTQESKVKYIIIFDRPLLGPLKGIVTPTTGYQYFQVVSLSIMTMSLCGAVPRDISFCLVFVHKSQK